MTDLNKLNESPLKYFISLENRARYKLIKRYNKPLSYHDVKIINDILYNEKTHYVEEFKEYLIYEDYNEFLKRFYSSLEINVKLTKILLFYEKYSKIYANYTVIPESKYMYKNIKRKQKIIDQMQNNDINDEYIGYDDSNEDMSNTVFSPRVINSIYSKTITTLNKSDMDENLSKNTEQSINDFLSKINLIENKMNVNKNKTLKDSSLIMKNSHKDFLFNKNKNKLTPQSSRGNHNINKFDDMPEKNKITDVRIIQPKKYLNKQNDMNSKKSKNNSNNSKKNVNNNANNKNYSNLIFINSYACKTKNNQGIFNNNNNSIGFNVNNSNTFNNDSRTFNGDKHSLKSNKNGSKQKLPTALLKQSIINGSKNINKYRENMNLTNINNYFTNVININNSQKYKLSLGETLLKFDKIVLSTNTSISPKIMNDNLISTNYKTNNIFQSKKKQKIVKQKESEKKTKKERKKNNQIFSSNKVINTKKIKTNLLDEYNSNSFGNNMTFLSNKFIENQRISTKLNKKKVNQKNNENLNNKEIENIYFKEHNKKVKKPESHRNFGHSKILSVNNSNTKNKINSSNSKKKNKSNNSNKKYRITSGLKNDIKYSSQKAINSPYLPNNSSSNFYFQSYIHTRKNSVNNLDKKIMKTLNENTKKKVLNNFNLYNSNINENSTQINIYTGNDAYKSLHGHNKSVFNSSNLIPENTSSKSPQGYPSKHGTNIKNKKNNIQANLMNNKNNTYFKSNIKGKGKANNFNLDLKKIIHKQNIENEKAIISERQIANRKLFENLGKYFFKSKNDKNFNSNYLKNNNSIRPNNISKNNNKKIKNKNFNNDYAKLINKIINKNYNSSKLLKNKTNNNTPKKSKYTPYITKNNKKAQNIYLSPQDNEQMKKMNKASSKQNLNYNNIISSLKDLRNIVTDDGAKLLIHSERNKNSKIVFK